MGCILVVVLYGGRIIIRCMDWYNAFILFSSAVETYFGSVRARFNLVEEFMKKGWINEVEI